MVHIRVNEIPKLESISTVITGTCEVAYRKALGVRLTSPAPLVLDKNSCIFAPLGKKLFFVISIFLLPLV